MTGATGQADAACARVRRRTFLSDRLQLIALFSLVKHRAVHQTGGVAQRHLRARIRLLHNSHRAGYSQELYLFETEMATMHQLRAACTSCPSRHKEPASSGIKPQVSVGEMGKWLINHFILLHLPLLGGHQRLLDDAAIAGHVLHLLPAGQLEVHLKQPDSGGQLLFDRMKEYNDTLAEQP